MNEKHEFQTGILHVLTTNIYFFMVTNVYFILSIIFSLTWGILLERSLLDILPLILTGPALVTLSSFLLQFIEMNKESDLPNFIDYISIYKKNFKETLSFWVPYSLLVFILSINIQYYDWGNETLTKIANIFSIGIIIISTIIVIYMLIISSKFKFRMQDLLRISCYYIIMRMKITLGIVGIAFLTLFVTISYSEFFILFITSLIGYFFVKYMSPILSDIEENFVKQESNN